jgi:nitrogen fixation-related uncharacterized protein
MLTKIKENWTEYLIAVALGAGAVILYQNFFTNKNK